MKLTLPTPHPAPDSWQETPSMMALSMEGAAPEIFTLPRFYATSAQGWAIVPWSGIIGDYWGLTSDWAVTAVEKAATAFGTEKVLVILTSPGGYVNETYQLGEQIDQLAKKYALACYIPAQATSGAMLLAGKLTAKSKMLFADPMAIIGSVGVRQGRAEQISPANGRRVHLFADANRKLWGDPYYPLGEEERDALNKGVKVEGSKFREAVAATGVGSVSFWEERLAGSFPASLFAKELGIQIVKISSLMDSLKGSTMPNAQTAMEALQTPADMQALQAELIAMRAKAEQTEQELGMVRDILAAKTEQERQESLQKVGNFQKQIQQRFPKFVQVNAEELVKNPQAVALLENLVAALPTIQLEAKVNPVGADAVGLTLSAETWAKLSFAEKAAKYREGYSVV